MGNNFKNQAQRDHWNKYNNAYSKRNYKTVTIKLNVNSEKFVIDYLESFGKPFGTTVKDILKKEASKK